MCSCASGSRSPSGDGSRRRIKGAYAARFTVRRTSPRTHAGTTTGYLGFATGTPTTGDFRRRLAPAAHGGAWPHGHAYLLRRWGNLNPLAAAYTEWSPYADVLNDPARLNDPDGRSPHIIVGAAVGFAVELAIQSHRGKVDPVDLAIATGTGAPTGGISALGRGLTVTVLSDTAISVGQRFAQAKLGQTETYGLAQFGQDAALGFILGGREAADARARLTEALGGPRANGTNPPADAISTFLESASGEAMSRQNLRTEGSPRQVAPIVTDNLRLPRR